MDQNNAKEAKYEDQPGNGFIILLVRNFQISGVLKTIVRTETSDFQQLSAFLFRALLMCRLQRVAGHVVVNEELHHRDRARLCVTRYEDHPRGAVVPTATRVSLNSVTHQNVCLNH